MAVPDVFISYASEDRDWAERILDALERLGLGCWMAPRDIPAGRDYGEAIIEALASCRAVVLVLSRDACASIFVRREVERAVSRGLPVLPVRIEDTVPAGSLEFYLASAQWIDVWSPPLDDRLAPVAATVRAHVGSAGAAVDEARARLKWGRHARHRRWLAGAAAIGAITAAALTVWLWNDGPAWRRDAVAFLVGSWCTATDDGYNLRTEFLRAGPAEAITVVHHSHSPNIGRSRVRVETTGDGLAISAVDEQQAATRRMRVIDARTLLTVDVDGRNVDGPLLVRCHEDQ